MSRGLKERFVDADGEDVGLLTSVDRRCPHCSSHVRAGSDWCTLCYADLRPPQERAAVDPPVTTVAEGFGPDGIAETGEDVAQRPAVGRRRRAAHDTDEPVSEDIEAVAEQMLARLAESESRNPLGPLAGVLDTTGKRAAFIVVGAGLAMLVIFLLMLGLGLLL